MPHKILILAYLTGSLVSGVSVSKALKYSYPYEVLKEPRRYDHRYIHEPTLHYAPQGFQYSRYVQPKLFSSTPISILRQSPEIHYIYGTENRIKAIARGDSRSGEGFFFYKAPDGTPISTNWLAAENGFRAEGSHQPVSPSFTPPSLQYVGALPYSTSFYY